MPTLIRDFEEGSFYHIYNRGVRKQMLFCEEQDYGRFLGIAIHKAKKCGVRVLAYCLMRNHYHFLIQLDSPDARAIRKWIGGTAMSYGRYFNKKYDQSGAVFQGPYRSRLIPSDEQLFWMSQYIHNNPAEFTNPNTYKWSSLKSYQRGKKELSDPTFVLEYLKGRSYELAEKSNFLSKQKLDFIGGYVD